LRFVKLSTLQRITSNKTPPLSRRLVQKIKTRTPLGAGLDREKGDFDEDPFRNIPQRQANALLGLITADNITAVSTTTEQNGPCR
jgi:hypothetical protein